MSKSILTNKRILAVDDEPDVLESLEELLEGFEGLILDKAYNYDDGYHLLRSWSYDAVILDIMGVRGFDLLNAAVSLGFPSIMLTAHALSIENLKKSIQMGARAFLPKEKMVEIVPFLEDVLGLEYHSAWRRSFERLKSVFKSSFGEDWHKNEKIFLQEITSGQYDPTILRK
ncbi:MAG: response regulator [Deltaproteobacteria bacterium]|nr:response regulator [Deltaproteobacteria bacterium]